MTTTQLETFRTNDLALAAFLVVHGNSCQGTDWQERNCYWQFLLVPSLGELVELWVRQEGLVEPIAYNKVFNKMKQELLSALHGARD